MPANENTKKIGIYQLLQGTVPSKYKNNFIQKYRLIIKFFTRYLLNKEITDRVIEELSCESLRCCITGENGSMVPFKMLRPYFLANRTVEERSNFLLNHYRYFKDHYNKQFIEFNKKKGIVIGTIPGNDDEVIDIKYDSTMRREAELCLSIRNAKYRLYSISFNIYKYSDDEYAFAISNIQGPTKDAGDMQEITKKLTKDTFGSQPRYLLINLLFVVAKAMKINHVLAIHTNHHVFMDKKHIGKQGSKMFADYDSLWENYTPKVYDDCFVEIFEEPRKNMEDIQSKKRSQYKKRYAWFDELEANVMEAFAE